MAKLTEAHAVVLDGRLVGVYTTIVEARQLQSLVLTHIERFREEFRTKYTGIPLEGVALVELKDSTISSLTSFAGSAEGLTDGVPAKGAVVSPLVATKAATDAVRAEAAANAAKEKKP